jgi:6-phosphogluconolactonase
MKPQVRTSVLYSAVGGRLTRYEVNVEAATLGPRESIELSAKLQYAWAHPSHKCLFVTTSNGSPRVESDYNHVAVFEMGTAGALEWLGEPRPLACRAVHLCVDPAGRYTVNAHNFPKSGLTIHRIESDGRVGAEVEQPGALRSFGFDEGILSPGAVVAPNGGYGFGPRHVAFHPSKPWLYVSDERTNRLYMFRYAEDQIETEPAYVRDTVAEPQNVRPRQLGGPIHVHPTGPFVYMANRADHTVEVSGKKVFGGGENNIAVYAIDAATGEPADGRPDFARKYDVATSGSELQYWMGIAGLQ